MREIKEIFERQNVDEKNQEKIIRTMIGRIEREQKERQQKSDRELFEKIQHLQSQYN